MAKKAAAAEAAPAKPAKAAKPEKAKVERVQANGVTRPADGTNTGKVWAHADKISAKNKRPATRAEVMEAAKADGINEATIATQYQAWRKFFGVPKAVKAPAEKEPKGAKAAAKKASKGTAQAAAG